MRLLANAYTFRRMVRPQFPHWHKFSAAAGNVKPAGARNNRRAQRLGNLKQGLQHREGYAVQKD
jgi:hypothetical protein